MEQDLKARSVLGQLVLPIAGLIIAGAMIHACGGGGGSSSGGSPPAPASPPPPTSFIVNFRSPTSGATDVPKGTAIYIGFNSTLNPATMTSANIKLFLGAVEQNTSLEYDACLNRVRMVPGTGLMGQMIYTVDLGAGVMSAGAVALTPTSFDFTTNAPGDSVRPVFDSSGNMATAASTTQLTLDWNAATDNVDAGPALVYEIYQMTPAGCFNFAAAPAATTGAGINTVLIAGLQPMTTYSFIIRARDTSGNLDLNMDVVQGTTMTSFITNVRPIVTTQCQSCHNPGGTATQSPYFVNMNYTTAQTNYDSWVNVVRGSGVCPTPATGSPFEFRVLPFDRTDSFLFNKIDANPPACGVTMPFGLPQISQAERDIIGAWIDEGALNN